MKRLDWSAIVYLNLSPIVGAFLVWVLIEAIVPITGWAAETSTIISFMFAIFVWGWLYIRVANVTLPQPKGPAGRETKETAIKNNIRETQGTKFAIIEKGENYPRGEFEELSISDYDLRYFAIGVLSGRDLTEAEWVGKGKRFSRNQFVELRSFFLRKGVLAWNNSKAHAQGLRVTTAGWAVFEYLATDPAFAKAAIDKQTRADRQTQKVADWGRFKQALNELHEEA